MRTALTALVERLEGPSLEGTNVIPWGCPVPSFGDPTRAKIATLGLNPSNREFVDVYGNELDGEERRFHTLKSLGINRWSEATSRHLRLIAESCRAYFCRNPYNAWFKKLDYLIAGTQTSYYNNAVPACHLDLIPYATTCKWTSLSRQQRSSLLSAACDTLGMLILESPIRVLILNGNSVVERFQEICSIELQKEVMPAWALPRRSETDVVGFAYAGMVRDIGGVSLRRDILILGFNHNIQSSFGVTTQVTASIQQWITKMTREQIREPARS